MLYARRRDQLTEKEKQYVRSTLNKPVEIRTYDTLLEIFARRAEA